MVESDPVGNERRPPPLHGVQIGDDNLQVNYFTMSAPAPTWPLQVGRPPRRAAYFQARSALVGRISASLGVESATVLTQVVTAGNGGVGKTQLAAYIFAEARREGTDLVVWVSATDRSAVVSTYADAYGAVTGEQVGHQGAERAAGRFLDWLATTPRSWLIVLDDVARANDLIGLWPEGIKGSVLVTTRLRDLGEGFAAKVPIDVFTRRESIAYLAARLAGSAANPGRTDALEEAPELASDLGDLPVALAQAAAVISDEGITCAEYRQRFADRAAALDDLFGLDPPDEYSYAVAATWDIAAARADQQAPTGLSRPALAVAAFLDPNGAPDGLWEARPIIDFVAGERARRSSIGAERQSDEGVTKRSMRSALRRLHRLSLLSHDPNGGPLAVRTHAMVQRAIANALPDDVTELAIRAAADALFLEWPDPEHDTVESFSLRSNSFALGTHPGTALWLPRVHPIILRAGNSLGDAGLAQAAVDYFASAINKTQDMVVVNREDAFQERLALARWQGEGGRASDAVAGLEVLIHDMEEVLGAGHPDVLEVGIELARWRGEIGDAQDAAAELRRIVSGLERTLGSESRLTLLARRRLAWWQGEAGDPAGALAEFGSLVADMNRVLGHDHLDLLLARLDSTWWQGESGDPRGAADSLRQLASEMSQILGPENPNTLQCRRSLARWLGESGDANGAATALSELIPEMVRLFGADYPDTLLARLYHVHWLGEAGSSVEATRLANPLFAELKAGLGRDHPYTLWCELLLAWRRGESGDVDGAARALEREVVPHLESVYGFENHATLQGRALLVRFRALGGSSSTDDWEEILSDHRRILGPDHLQTKQVMHWRLDANR